MTTFDSEHSNRVLEDALSHRGGKYKPTGKEQNGVKGSMREAISPIARTRCEGSDVGRSSTDALSCMPPPFANSLVLDMELAHDNIQDDTGYRSSKGANKEVENGVPAGLTIKSILNEREAIPLERQGTDGDMESQFSFSTTVAESLEIF